MSSLLPDLTTRIHPEPPIDRFDQLPDSLLLLIFNFISDVKSLGRCSSLSRRFHSLIPHVHNILVRVDCVISDHDPSNSSLSPLDKSPYPLSSLFRSLLTNIVKPFQTLGLFFSPKRPLLPSTNSNGNADDLEQGGAVTHHSPTQVLKNFNQIKFLKIELPSGELGLEDNVLLRWRAHFGSTLDNCVMLGASSVVTSHEMISDQVNDNVVSNSNSNSNSNGNGNNDDGNDDNDDGSIPESFYTNGGLKLRVVWTISSLIAASARHYLLQQIISEHRTLEELVLTDADGQGVLCMNKEQLEELRVKPLAASSASKRTMVPALNMRLWYAPRLELPDGTVLKGATLVATRPSEQVGQKEGLDGLWGSFAFEEPFGTAARMLVKRRTYCLEMNSF